MPCHCFVVLLLLLQAPTAGAQAPVPAPRADAPNVLLIVADDLNADRGAYGGTTIEP
jgi:hypothetical protein